MILGGIQWVNVQGGISHVTLEPTSHCLCGLPEDVTLYFLQGCERDTFVRQSLYDPADQRAQENLQNPPEAAEPPVDSPPDDEKKAFVEDHVFHWDQHVDSVTESTLLERTPACGFDYLYHLEVPEDNVSELLSQVWHRHSHSNRIPFNSIETWFVFYSVWFWNRSARSWSTATWPRELYFAWRWVRSSWKCPTACATVWAPWCTPSASTTIRNTRPPPLPHSGHHRVTASARRLSMNSSLWPITCPPVSTRSDCHPLTAILRDSLGFDSFGVDWLEVSNKDSLTIYRYPSGWEERREGGREGGRRFFYWFRSGSFLRLRGGFLIEILELGWLHLLVTRRWRRCGHWSCCRFIRTIRRSTSSGFWNAASPGSSRRRIIPQRPPRSLLQIVSPLQRLPLPLIMRTTLAIRILRSLTRILFLKEEDPLFIQTILC